MFSLVIIFANVHKRFYDKSYSLLFAEFLQSSDFEQLLKDNTHSFNYRVNGGTYNSGIPFSPSNENVYGTNRGVRIIPLIALLHVLQIFFGVLWDRVYFLVILILPMIGFLAAAFFLNNKKQYNRYAFVSSFLFSFNPWIFSRLETGFWQLHIAYACLPWLWFAGINIFNNYKKYTEFLFVISVSSAMAIIYFFQPQFLVMIVPSIIVYLAFLHKDISTNNIVPAILRILKILLVFVLLTGFHIIPSLLYRPYAYADPSFFHMAAINFNGSGSSLLDVINLSPRSPMVVSKVSAFSHIFQSGFFIIPFTLLFIGARNSKRRINEMVMYIIFILGFVFLAKGLHMPFKSLSYVLYKYITPLHSFRDPSRFYSAIVLFLSVGMVSFKKTRVNNTLIAILLSYMLINIFVLSHKSLNAFEYVQIPVKEYQSSKPLKDQSRMMIFPPPGNISKYSWASRVITSTYSSPFEALKRSSKNLAQYSGDTDSLFSQAQLFASESIIRKKDYSTDLVKRLHVSQILYDSELIATDEAKGALAKISDVHIQPVSKNITTYNTLQPEQFASDEKPLFFVGERNQYAEFIKKIQIHAPVIFLQQPINTALFKKLDLHNQTIVSNDEQSLSNVFLNGLNSYSLHLHSIVRDYDKQWAPYMPYAIEEIKKGILFSTSTPIAANKPGSELKISPRKIGTYVFALNMLNGEEYGDIEVYIDSKKIKSNSTKNTNGFYWRQYIVDLSIDSSIFLQSTSARTSIISDALLIPKNVYETYKKDYDRIIKNNNVLFIDRNEESRLLQSNQEGSATYSQVKFDSWEINNASDWTTMRFPFDYGWGGDGIKGVFISDGYAMTFYNPHTPLVNVVYKSEWLFRILLKLSQFASISIGLLLLIALIKRAERYLSNQFFN